MNRTLIGLTIVIGSLAGLGYAGLRQPEEKKQPGAAPAAPAAPDKKQIAAMMATHGQAGEEHKVLEALVGSFDVVTKMSLMPGAPPLSIASTSNAQWVLNNRFVHTTMKATPDEEIRMEAISYFGFDGRTRKYFWWGIDNTDTYSVFAEGDYDPATRTLTLLGENLEPALGTMKFKTVVKLDRPDSHSVAIIFQAPEAMRPSVPAGTADKDGWFTVMEMTCTRKK